MLSKKGNNNNVKLVSKYIIVHYKIKGGRNYMKDYVLI